MRKFLTILLVIAIVLALAAAAGAGFIWYKNNHIFVEGETYPLNAQSLDLREKDIGFDHYDQIHAQLPKCEILWNVPFQSGKAPNTTRELTVKSLSEPDAAVLRYFPELKKLTVTDTDQHTDYPMLISVQKQYPQVDVIYQVNLGGSKSFPLDSTELTLAEGEYTDEFLQENLKYLPNVKTVTQKMDLGAVMNFTLKETYPEVEFKYTVELMGQEYGEETTHLDLSSLTAEEARHVADNLAMLPNLQTVELMDASGKSKLSKEDVRSLMSIAQQVAPNVSFHYVFDFFGETLSTDMEEVHLKNKKIGDEGIGEVRAALDLMGSNCKRFVLESCGISYDLLAQVRDEYRDKTKVVWRVNFGKGSCMTDVQAIRAVYDLVDDNCANLIYCEDVKYIDIGHNEYLDGVPFVAGMPNLEYIIVSGAPVKDLTPFANCKKLKFLELAFCGYIDDLSPLAGCESLEKLNIANTKVSDLSPLKDLPMTHLTLNDSKVSSEEREQFIQDHPDCLVKNDGNPYGAGWRYVDEKNTQKYPYYAMLGDVFGYPDNTFNHTGKYTDITLADYVKETAGEE